MFEALTLIVSIAFMFPALLQPQKASEHENFIVPSGDCGQSCAGNTFTGRDGFVCMCYREIEFWKKVIIGGIDECWNWKGRGNRKGFEYGRFMFHGKNELSNRLAFQFSRHRPPTHCALHHCDNPRCCNPWHLYDGTRAENNRDCMIRGRHRSIGKPGEQSHLAKLSLAQVNEIRTCGGLPSVAAKRFKVSVKTVYRIRTRKTWK